MKREPVESSMLVSIGYDVEQRILELEFNSGKVYQYFEVPAQVYQDMMKDDSKGSYFQAVIDGTYNYIQVKR
jgi:hypothetical protein